MSQQDNPLRCCIKLSKRADKLETRPMQQHFFNILNLLREKWFENIKFLFPNTEVLKTLITLHTISHKFVADETGQCGRSMLKNSSGSYYLQWINGLV